MIETQQAEKLETEVVATEEQEVSVQEESVVPENLVQVPPKDHVINPETATDIIVADEPGAETKEVSPPQDDNISRESGVSQVGVINTNSLHEFWDKSNSKLEELNKEITPLRDQVNKLNEQCSLLKRKRQSIRSSINYYTRLKGGNIIPKKSLPIEIYNERLSTLDIEIKNIAEELDSLSGQISNLSEQIYQLETQEYRIRFNLNKVNEILS